MIKFMCFMLNLVAQCSIAYLAISEKCPTIAGRIRIGFGCWQTLIMVIELICLMVLVIACFMAESQGRKNDLKESGEKLSKFSIWSFISRYIQTPLFATLCVVYGFWWLFALEMLCVPFWIATYILTVMMKSDA